jgi:hypothetical protein
MSDLDFETANKLFFYEEGTGKLIRFVAEFPNHNLDLVGAG